MFSLRMQIDFVSIQNNFVTVRLIKRLNVVTNIKVYFHNEETAIIQ